MEDKKTAILESNLNRFECPKFECDAAYSNIDYKGFHNSFTGFDNRIPPEIVPN